VPEEEEEEEEEELDDDGNVIPRAPVLYDSGEDEVNLYHSKLIYISMKLKFS
jgi:hypothetical protein